MKILQELHWPIDCQRCDHDDPLIPSVSAILCIEHKGQPLSLCMFALQGWSDDARAWLSLNRDRLDRKGWWKKPGTEVAP